MNTRGKAPSRAATIAWVVVVGFVAAGFSATAASAARPGSFLEAWSELGMLVGFASGASMIWRASHPAEVWIGNVAAALIFPIDALGAVVGLAMWLPHAPRNQAIGGTFLTTGAVALALWRDVERDAGLALLATTDEITGAKEPLSVGAVAVIGIAMIAVAVAVGLARRYRANEQQALQVANAREVEVGQLRGERTRQQERDAIAREMHDTVAHELSLLSLRSAALEVSTADPDAALAAREMRGFAQRALDEMRTLIGSLRDSDDGGYSGATGSFEALRALVEDAQSAGLAVAAVLRISDAPATPAVARATYRIVQEAMTNAIRHEPGSGVSVRVSADPQSGVTIGVANWINTPNSAPVGASTVGSGTGLVGMKARAEALGGHLEAGPSSGMWVVRGWLPWGDES